MIILAMAYIFRLLGTGALAAPPATAPMSARPAMPLPPLPSVPANTNEPLSRMTTQAACMAFRDLLIVLMGDGELMWRQAYKMYSSVAVDSGWPLLSEKALSMGLTELGLHTIQRDLRAQGRGRPMVLVWSMGAVDTINLAA